MISFVLLSVAWRRPRLQEVNWRPLPELLSRLLINRVSELVAGTLAILLLVLVVWAGLEGSNEPDDNIALIFPFVTVWIGVVVASALFGDVFRALNPWRALARLGAGGFRLIAGQPGRPFLRYPERLGRWPAAVGVIAFFWLELVYATNGFEAVGIEPRAVAVAALLYTLYTLAAMAAFGIDTWLDRGETFSVYFRMFSELSPLEVRDGRLGRRRPLAAAASWAIVPGSLALVVATIGGTIFDGAQEGVLQQPIASVLGRLQDAGFGFELSVRASESLFFAFSLAAVALIYWTGIWGMRHVRRSPGLAELGRAFTHTVIPIALAYLVAHYFSLLVYAEQLQFTRLLSDPLGRGWDLFGTANAGLNYTFLGRNFVWYVQVAALVCGHVTGLLMAHDRALAIYGDIGRAARSQRWMLAVMVVFTSLGIFLLSRGNA